MPVCVVRQLCVGCVLCGCGVVRGGVVCAMCVGRVWYGIVVCVIARLSVFWVLWVGYGWVGVG